MKNAKTLSLKIHCFIFVFIFSGVNWQLRMYWISQHVLLCHASCLIYHLLPTLGLQNKNKYELREKKIFIDLFFTWTNYANQQFIFNYNPLSVKCLDGIAWNFKCIWICTTQWVLVLVLCTGELHQKFRKWNFDFFLNGRHLAFIKPKFVKI